MLIFTSLMGVPNAKAASPLDSILKFMGAKKEEINTEINNFSENKTESKNDQKKDMPKISGPDEIEKAAEFASKATGVRKDFLMGMLVVETNLGKNTGQCTYKEVEGGARTAYNQGRLSQKSWNTFLRRSDIVKDLSKDLGYNYEEVKVSCNPAYTGTGGALGVPQFMPDTWMEYKDSISKIVGKENPDPWNTLDGVVAMAVKLADVPGVTNHNQLAERNAAKMYLSGTTSSTYEWYANQAFYWSLNYSKLLA